MFKLLRRGLGLVSVMLLAACGGGGGGGGGGSSGGGSSAASSSLAPFTCPAGTAISTPHFSLSTNAIQMQAVAGAVTSTSADVTTLSIANTSIKVLIEFEGLGLNASGKAGGVTSYTAYTAGRKAGTYCGYVVYTAKDSGGVVLSTAKVAVQLTVKNAQPVSANPAYVCPGASSSTATGDFSLSTVNVSLTGTAGLIGTSSSQTVGMTVFNGSVDGVYVTKIVPEVDWLVVTTNLVGSYATVTAMQEYLLPGTYCAVVNVAVRAGASTLSSRAVAVKLVLAAPPSSSSSASSVSSSADSSSSAAASSSSMTSSAASSSAAASSAASSAVSSVPASSSSSSSTSSSAAPVSVQAFPGSASNPVLSSTEAGLLQMSNYLLYGPSGMDPWSPLYAVPDCVNSSCLNVGSGQTYATIQAAVQAATSMSGSQRVFIRVHPGSYAGPVIVPNVSGAPPISIVGTSANASDVVVSATIGANTTGAQYSSAYSSTFATTDNAYSTYNGCASKSSSIGTSCSAVFWSRAANIQIANLTVQNLAAPGATQAVAFESEGDKTYLYKVRLISRQDTVYLKTPSAGTIARAYMKDSYVEGDVDYVFGRATAVFEGVTFKSMSDRSSTSYVFAPSTAPGMSYGFHVINSTFTTDGGFGGKAQLGRSWDESAGSTYVAGTSPNGQLVIRDSSISGDYAGSAPWAKAATTGRAYAGNASAGRSLDDSNYNRLWQYNNTGSGAVN